MDLSNRPAQPQPAAHHANGVAASGPAKRSKNKGKWGQIGITALVGAMIVLLIGIVLVLGFSNNNSDEGKYVDTTKLQAVFLNTGQVYFGNIKVLNDKYFVLTNIYYLQTSGSSSGTTSTTSSANSSVTLVKLGCEIHQPYDQMVINSDEVTFWENLQSSGQVAQAVATFQKENPNGQKCSDQSSSSSSTSNSVQNAGTKQ
jgi:hypothetical protein